MFVINLDHYLPIHKEYTATCAYERESTSRRILLSQI